MSIILTSKVNKKLEGYGKEMKHNGEIGGLILGKFLKDTGDIKIFDIIILSQVKTDTTFSISDEDMMNITKNYSSKQLSQVIGWWHSHGNMVFTEFSQPDSETFKRMCSLSGICVGILIYFDKKFKDMSVRCRVDTMTKLHGYISVDGVTPEIEQDIVQFTKNFFYDDIKGKVKEDKRKICDCPKCRGLGFVYYDYNEGAYKNSNFEPKHKHVNDNYNEFWDDYNPQKRKIDKHGDDKEEENSVYTKKMRDMLYG